MLCKHCNKPIQIIRGHRTRLYCNDACRQAACRQKKAQPTETGSEKTYGEYNELTRRCLERIQKQFGAEAMELAERAVNYSHL